MNIKKYFHVFVSLSDKEASTLEKRFTQEQLQSWLGSKLDSAIQKECEQIEIDQEFEHISKAEKL